MSNTSATLLSLLIVAVALCIAAVAFGRSQQEQRRRADWTAGEARHQVRVLLKERDVLHAQARVDDLTGLSNRRHLLERLDKVVDRGSSVAVAYLDLDRFKHVNDTYGHDAGDGVLREVAARLRQLPGMVHVAARLSGDEFVLMMVCPPDEAHDVAVQTWQVVTAPICLGSQTIAVGASIGLVTNGVGLPAERLVRHADHAMYEAKARGGGVCMHPLRPSSP